MNIANDLTFIHENRVCSKLNTVSDLTPIYEKSVCYRTDHCQWVCSKSEICQWVNIYTWKLNMFPNWILSVIENWINYKIWTLTISYMKIKSVPKMKTVYDQIYIHENCVCSKSIAFQKMKTVYDQIYVHENCVYSKTVIKLFTWNWVRSKAKVP